MGAIVKLSNGLIVAGSGALGAILTFALLTGLVGGGDGEPSANPLATPEVSPSVSGSPSANEGLFGEDAPAWVADHNLLGVLSSLADVSVANANSDGTLGSGCTSAPADSLPDGEWFGSLTSLSGAAAEFDLWCRFAPASTWAFENPAATGSTPDLFFRNTNPGIRVVPVADDLAVLTSAGATLRSEGQAWLDVSFNELWLVVRGGEIIAIAEHGALDNL